VCGVVWLGTAVASLAAPWFVVFAVMLWIGAPIVVVTVAGLSALAPAARPTAAAVVRGVAFALALAIVPSVLVIWGAVAQMGDNYF
jgi:hypothetical protein